MLQDVAGGLGILGGLLDGGGEAGATPAAPGSGAILNEISGGLGTLGGLINDGSITGTLPDMSEAAQDETRSAKWQEGEAVEQV